MMNLAASDKLTTGDLREFNVGEFAIDGGIRLVLAHCDLAIGPGAYDHHPSMTGTMMQALFRRERSSRGLAEPNYSSTARTSFCKTASNSCPVSSTSMHAFIP